MIRHSACFHKALRFAGSPVSAAAQSTPFIKLGMPPAMTSTRFPNAQHVGSIQIIHPVGNPKEGKCVPVQSVHGHFLLAMEYGMLNGYHIQECCHCGLGSASRRSKRLRASAGYPTITYAQFQARNSWLHSVRFSIKSKSRISEVHCKPNLTKTDPFCTPNKLFDRATNLVRIKSSINQTQPALAVAILHTRGIPALGHVPPT